MKINDTTQFRKIIDDLRNLPEESDDINAYGGDDEGVLLRLYEALCDEKLYDDISNAYIQLYSIDFQSKHEDIDTFYENFYECNERNDKLRACKWLNQNEASAWIYNNPDEIYAAYRKIMFEFEAIYLKN